MKTFSAWVLDGDVVLSYDCEMVINHATGRQTSVGIELGNVRVPVVNPYAAMSDHAAQTIADNACVALKAAQSVVVQAERWRLSTWTARETFNEELADVEGYEANKRLLEDAKQYGRFRWDDSGRGYKRMAQFVTAMQPLVDGKDVELREVLWSYNSGLGSFYTKLVWVIDGVEHAYIYVQDGEGRKPVDMYDAVELCCTPKSMTRNHDYWRTEPRTIDSKEPIR